MTTRLVEGQSFPPHFTLINKVGQPGKVESWLASNDLTHEKVLLNILTGQIDAAAWLAMIVAQGRQKGLIHQNISRVLEYDATDGMHYWSERYVEGGEHFSPQNQSASRIWQLLDALLTAIRYAHQLGIAHGRLHPGNLILTPSGTIHITGWGIPAALYDDLEYHAWLSPEAKNDQAPDFSDDYYSLGCLIFHSLTGKQWQPDLALDRPLPPEIAPLLSKMLQASPYERSVDLHSLQAALATHFDQGDGGIQSIAFKRGEERGEASRDQASAEQTGARQAPVLIRGQGRISTTRVLTALAALVAIALLLFFLPSGTITPVDEDSPGFGATLNSPEHQASPQSNTAPVIAPHEQARLAYLKEQAQEVTQTLLRRQIQLEDLGVSLWAGEEFAALSKATEDAEEQYRNKNFAAALAGYQQVIIALAALLEKAPSVLAEQIKIGDTALDAGEHQAALSAFTIASAIDGDDKNISAKLLRADNLEQVLAFIQQGESLERNGQLQSALAAYEEANSLDGTLGKSAIKRVRGRIRQQDFSDAMSRAFGAFAERNYTAARRHFIRAQKILPDSAEPADGLLQVQQAGNRDRINEHRQQAEEFLASWHWQSAITEYEAALTIDPTLVFASRGITRASALIALEASLEGYLSNPGLMQEDKALGKARETLVAASRTEPKPDKWLSYIDTLARLISNARIPIPVTFISDNKTAITVYKVGRFGLLTSKQLALIPGDYTVVGKRPGYRDVRHNFTLRSGQASAPIEIICSEKI